MNVKFCSLMVLMVCSGALPPVWGQGTYTVIDLGTLGGSSSEATAINDAGQVAGNSTTAAGENHAFRTAPNQRIVPATDDLGTLGGAATYAADINASGQVVGRSQLPGGTFHAFRTQPNVAIQSSDDLGTFGGPSSAANGINDVGQVTGTADTQSGLRPLEHAFRTAPDHPIDSTTLDIGALAPRYQGTIIPSIGLDINSTGNVAGKLSLEEIAQGYPTAFVYLDGQIVLPGVGGYAIYSAINDSNQVAVSNEGSAGYLFVNGTRTQICSCATLDINNPGQVVGSVRRPGTVGVPPFNGAVLIEGGTVTDLNTRIPANSGWTLLAATAINDVGQIAGLGLINGETHAVRLDPVTLPADWLGAEMSLLSSFHVETAVETSLLSSLRTAQESLQRGNKTAASDQLEAFKNKVRAQSGKKLTADQANQLLGATEACLGLIAQL